MLVESKRKMPINNRNCYFNIRLDFRLRYIVKIFIKGQLVVRFFT